jgi:hypothetical protein
MPSSIADGSELDAEEIVLCKRCYLDALRSARVEWETKRIQGVREAQAYVEWLDKEMSIIGGEGGETSQQSRKD